MKNQELADHLYLVAKLKSLDGAASFSIKAFEFAARQIQELPEAIETVDPCKITGVGKGIATDIKEFLATGTSSRFKELSKKYPPEMFTMTAVDGIGPKKAFALYQKGFLNFNDLLIAAQENKLDTKLRDAVLFANSKTSGRIPRSVALNIATRVKEQFEKIEGILKLEIAGSVRRKMLTCKDIDIAACVDSDKVREALFAKQSSLGQGFTGGEAKGSVKVHMSATGDGRQIVPIQVDLWIGHPEHWGALLNHCTGSKDHNVAMRTRAKAFGYTVNEYGIFNASGDRLGGEKETDLYDLLKLPYCEPENRTGRLQ